MVSKVLVTGATGFLGAYIVQALVQAGIGVRAIRRTDRLPFFLPADVAEKVAWVAGDVLDVTGLQEAMEGMDAVVHAAAVVSFAPQHRSLMQQVNVEGTANVVNMAIEAGVRRLVHISSVAALGRTGRNELVNESRKWTPHKHNTHYAISKHAAEMEVWRGVAEGLEAVVLNPSTILGFGNWHQSSCAIFRSAYRGFPWYTNGINGFVGVQDVARATVGLLLSEHNAKRFIVSAENISFRELLNQLATGFGTKKPYLEATPLLGALAWRLEAVKAAITRRSPLLTAETVRIGQSKTGFDGSALVRALPGFTYTPLQQVIGEACMQYRQALKSGLLTL